MSEAEISLDDRLETDEVVALYRANGWSAGQKAMTRWRR